MSTPESQPERTPRPPEPVVEAVLAVLVIGFAVVWPAVDGRLGWGPALGLLAAGLLLVGACGLLPRRVAAWAAGVVLLGGVLVIGAFDDVEQEVYNAWIGAGLLGGVLALRVFHARAVRSARGRADR